MNDTAWMDEITGRARVVVVRSPITDLGPLGDAAARLGPDCAEVVLGMGDETARARYRALREAVDHPTLPLVFVDRRFAGGIEAAARLRTLDTRMPAVAAACGYGGLIPFAAGAIALLAGGGPTVAAALLGYAAVILSFVGAVHWGMAVAAPAPSPPGMALSVVPALLAWPGVLLPPLPGMVVLAAALAGWRAVERLGWGDDGFPGWFRRLRDHLTAGAVVSLMLGAVGIGLA
ncbi:hypothetical protein KBTX_01606 [wastewater metagenome]|uniref:Uncharacterized protein n=2 Tax=unclassified sequences TaxID=12908 RepID=A0A5B8R951_9ZZZZ|nr:DUF3429 domain-containing protein [Arhodomonas sp. KWT]QEA05286.1 hypothetical protein KBTEX_01606 [uncultured organism]